MDARAEELVLAYLRRLEDSAQQALGPDERRAFLARSRATLARQAGETRAAGAHDVRRLLRRFGDPRKLVAQERRRLDAAAKRDTGKPSGQPGPPGPGRQRPVTTASDLRPSAAPSLGRPLTARWRPGADLVEARRPAPALRNLPGWRGFPRWTGSGGRAPGDGSGCPRPDRSAGPGPSADGSWRRPGEAGPPATPHPADPASPQVGRPRPSEVLALARRHPLECGAILLLGLGGLIGLFPLWLLGALAALVSRWWDGRDKLAAVAVPLAVAALGAIALGGLNSKAPSLSGYAHGMRADGWDLIRAGAVFAAAYLARRMRRGPRPLRQPPWRRVPQG